MIKFILLKKLIDKLKSIKWGVRRKKEDEEPEYHPYMRNDYCYIKENVDHQGIAGKRAYFTRKVTLREIIDKALDEGNIACRNFMLRRPDLFEDPSYGITKDKAYKRTYHYVHIWNNPEHLDGNYTFLGYVVASDEIEKIFKWNFDEV